MQPGTLINGRYRIVRRIAEGGQAAVFLAQQEPLGRQIALKILRPGLDANEQERLLFLNRFRREAQALAGFDHPNIVVIYDYGATGDGAYYIAMEYVEGVRFNDLLRAGPMEPARALRLVLQVCDALRYAHNQKVIHRDIKHSNLLIRERNGAEQVKVVDFGIAKMMEDETGLTLTGVVLGSPHFMAPEQARGSALSHRVDIYAVGVLLYCCLVGRYPFDGGSFHKIVLGHLGHEIPPFAKANPNVQLEPGLEAIVRRCLAKEPSQRFPDVDALMQTLSAFVENRTSFVLDQDTVEHMPPTDEDTHPGLIPNIATSPKSADPTPPKTPSKTANHAASGSAAGVPASGAASSGAGASAGAGVSGLPWWVWGLGIGFVAFVVTTALLGVLVVLLWPRFV